LEQELQKMYKRGEKLLGREREREQVGELPTRVAV
jgi:hypothetical protein